MSKEGSTVPGMGTDFETGFENSVASGSWAALLSEKCLAIWRISFSKWYTNSPHNLRAMPKILPLDDIGWRARDGKAGVIPGEDSRHLLLFTKPRQGPGTGCWRASEWNGKGARKDKDSAPAFRLPLPTHGASITPGNKRAKAIAEASPETFAAPKLARISLDTQSHTRSLPPSRRVSAGTASPSPHPSRGRRALHPRTHLPPVALAAGTASARTAAGPAPVRSLLPAPPSPRPREVGPAAAPESRSGLPELSRSLPPPLLGGSAVRLGPDVIRTTAGSSLLSSTTAFCPTHLCLVDFWLALEELTGRVTTCLLIDLTSKLVQASFESGQGIVNISHMSWMWSEYFSIFHNARQSVRNRGWEMSPRIQIFWRLGKCSKWRWIVWPSHLFSSYAIKKPPNFLDPFPFSPWLNSRHLRGTQIWKSHRRFGGKHENFACVILENLKWLTILSYFFIRIRELWAKLPLSSLTEKWWL